MSDYKAAVETLNLYQIVGTQSHPLKTSQNLSLLRKATEYFQRMGHSVEELNQLNAIHIAGTKGKGSVAAMCESILRRHDLQTGLLTSPHLLEIRERIKINGVSLSCDQFAEYFWECFRQLDSSKRNERAMPNHYRLLALLAFHVFLREKVDVAIIEVGKGGAYDTTNIIPTSVVCGITVLDLDHVGELGDTLEKIAWHKAGIVKSGCPLVVHPQEPGPLRVIAQRATELQASSIEIAPNLTDYPGEEITLGISGRHNLSNASLAAQLCKKWLTLKGLWTEGPDTNGVTQRKDLCGVSIAQPFLLTRQFYDGLSLVSWPGRCQIERRKRITFYLDSAHTPLSMKACVEWFKEEAEKEAQDQRGSGQVARVLLFNFIGRRDARALLEPLPSCGFDYALFAPSYTGAGETNTPDQVYRKATPEALYKCSRDSEQVWVELCSNHHGNTTNDDITITSPLPTKTQLFPSLDHAIYWCSRGRDLSMNSTSPDRLSEVASTPDYLLKASHVQVLVTGSVRLVGTTMYVLDCSLT